MDAADHLLTAGSQTYTSDLDGNTLTDGTRTNVWDSQNRLTSCTAGGVTSTYTYGADGLRRSSTVNGVTTYYVYDGTMLVREMQRNTQGNLQSTATYLCGPRGPEYRRDDTQAEGTYTDASGTQHPAGKTRWYVYDGLGSVVGEVDPSGNLTSSGTFDVYGAKRAGGTGAATSQQGFVGSLGHVTDSETGLVYMRARYYDPSTGRFISEDSAKSGNNWFAYCDNNPTNEVDADGEVAAFIGAAVVGAFMGVGMYLQSSVYDHSKLTWAGVGKAAALGAITALIAFAMFTGVGALLGNAAIASFANAALTPIELAIASEAGFFAGVLGEIGGHNLKVATTGYFIEIGLALAATDPDCPDLEAAM